MLENEIKLYEADSEQSIEAQMNELAELEVLNQSKSASAGETSTQMVEQTNMLRKIFKEKFLIHFEKKVSIFFHIYHFFIHFWTQTNHFSSTHFEESFWESQF